MYVHQIFCLMYLWCSGQNAKISAKQTNYMCYEYHQAKAFTFLWQTDIFSVNNYSAWIKILFFLIISVIAAPDTAHKNQWNFTEGSSDYPFVVSSDHLQSPTRPRSKCPISLAFSQQTSEQPLIVSSEYGPFKLVRRTLLSKHLSLTVRSSKYHAYFFHWTG